MRAVARPGRIQGISPVRATSAAGYGAAMIDTLVEKKLYMRAKSAKTNGSAGDRSHDLSQACTRMLSEHSTTELQTHVSMQAAMLNPYQYFRETVLVQDGRFMVSEEWAPGSFSVVSLSSQRNYPSLPLRW